MDGNGEKSEPPKRIMSSKLYVGNLPFATTAQELEERFNQAGTVTAVDLVFDKFTGRSRGFAFVTMATPADAQRVIEQFNGNDFGGRPLMINEARPREERPAPREFAGGDRRSFGGRGSPRNERNYRR